ncbi:ABC transporter permease [Defluviitalea raffinosedens]|uniref:ABC transporter permease n=1 Tax=Defluviitalea raffinosedens TaxID=1450156 RepID=UPI00195997BD|nr:ABC transporter permease [Defluviitalea raffinosedens]
MSKNERLHRKFDKIRQMEESGQLRNKKQGNRTLRKLLNNRLAVFGGVIFLIIVLACIFAPLLTDYSPKMVDMKAILKAPSMEHLFGTDKIGRDIFSRVLYGGRMSIAIGFGSALGCAAIGVLLGCYSAYRGGFFDSLMVRISEIFMSIPQLILVLMLVSILGQSAKNIVIIFIICGWGSSFRMARSKVLSIREEEYVQSLKVFGLNPFIICYKHILPNALGPIIVNLTLSTAMFILEEAALSFLGLGVSLEVPTWGNILNAAQDIYTLQNNWWMWLPTGIVVSLFVMSINFIGDGIRDTTDPTMQG